MSHYSTEPFDYKISLEKDIFFKDVIVVNYLIRSYFTINVTVLSLE